MSQLYARPIAWAPAPQAGDEASLVRVLTFCGQPVYQPVGMLRDGAMSAHFDIDGEFLSGFVKVARELIDFDFTDYQWDGVSRHTHVARHVPVVLGRARKTAHSASRASYSIGFAGISLHVTPDAFEATVVALEEEQRKRLAAIPRDQLMPYSGGIRKGAAREATDGNDG